MLIIIFIESFQQPLKKRIKRIKYLEYLETIST